MTDMYEFIEREIVPTLSGFRDEYDLCAIFDEVTEFDPKEGFVWRECLVDKESGCDTSLYWDIVESHIYCDVFDGFRGGC